MNGGAGNIANSSSNATGGPPERDQFDKLLRESKLLKQKVDQLERENSSLKKSIYDLSTRYSYALHHQHHHPSRPFFVIDPSDVPASTVSSNNPATNDGDATKEFVPELESMSPAIQSDTNRRDKYRDGRIFHQKYELKGHSGAVYVVQHSRCGRFLASGSFDKSIKIWDTTGTMKEVSTLKKHALNVSDVSWGHDSSTLLSGAYDQTCKLWDVAEQKMTASFDAEGFVQCVAFHPEELAMFFYGTSRNVLASVDSRKNGSALYMKNDAMINTLQVHRDGNYVLTGDALGALKTWDVRVGRCVHSHTVESSRKPLSHIAVCGNSSNDDDDSDPRIIAVNSYDNVIRVYDRGADPLETQPKMLHALKGYKNRNWPIKSSFFNGKDYALRRSSSHEDVYSGTGADVSSESSFDGSDSYNKSLDNTVLLATGSADPYAYVYNVSGGGVAEGSNSPRAELVQRLEGHTDRVYAVAFHPFEPTLATCSADFSIRIWGTNAKIKKK